MDIGIVTIAYNGYGIFLKQWCRSILALDTRPTAITVALGRNHGLTDAMRADCLALLPDLKIVEDMRVPTMGRLRNVAVRATHTEWIMYLSIDDAILPHAIGEYEKFEDEADYICIQWLTRGLGRREVCHYPKLPIEMAKLYRGRGFIVGHSPYRRRFWELTPYEEHDYPNAPFLASMVENGARFVKSDRPCTVYQRRPDSHARAVLRRFREEKQKAVFYKRDMERRLEAYYAE